MDTSTLKSIPLFASLNRRELALVARHADEVDVPAGEMLAREGEVAREFFVIKSGTATVTRDGKEVNHLGPGDFFGEIGLLETPRRIATVTSDSPMQLIVMFGPEFTAVESEIKEIDQCIRKAIARRMANG
ncbi:MAG TPA: cyclic nucleotide-binding domain-containing protein [Acidimicrobiia bacterium]|nr:cyclic nucleotide-binding domain-containing protein [Acidimicrobiia bacterium]